MLIPPKKLFLIDSLGALFSALLLGVVLVNFESAFGIPKNVFYFLALIASLFLFYSSLCYFFLKENWKPYLITIAAGNLLYCCLTVGVLFYFYETITVLGMLYFIGEVAVILMLAIVELKSALVLGATALRKSELL